MNIDTSKHFVTIPKEEYERIINTIETKKDIRVEFRIHTFSSYRSILIPIIYEMNESIDSDIISKASKLIQKTIDDLLIIKDKQIDIYKSELENIKSKWWYKLFN